MNDRQLLDIFNKGLFVVEMGNGCMGVVDGRKWTDDQKLLFMKSHLGKKSFNDFGV